MSLESCDTHGYNWASFESGLSLLHYVQTLEEAFLADFLACLHGIARLSYFAMWLLPSINIIFCPLFDISFA